MNIGQKIFLSGVMAGYSLAASGQVRIAGKVLDGSGLFPVESVSVLSNSKTGTITDKSGSFELIVTQKDSIWFSYLGKTTSKFFVEEIMHIQDFTVSINVPAPTLPAVLVTGRNYRLDSINNRIDYKKVFDYQKPSFNSIFKSISVTGFVVDLDELIRLFRFREKTKMTNFRNRLFDAEQQKFISRKFNRLVIKEVIDIAEEELTEFILLYTPDYLFAVTASAYEMKKYIKDSYGKYRSR